VDPKAWPTPAMTRRNRLIAKYNSVAPHITTSKIRRYVAVDTESASPVPTATYAARHIGHFGNNARMALGKIHPAISRPRRVNIARDDSAPRTPRTIALGRAARASTSQQR
jgi:hypothetical protein